MKFDQYFDSENLRNFTENTDLWSLRQPIALYSPLIGNSRTANIDTLRYAILESAFSPIATMPLKSMISIGDFGIAGGDFGNMSKRTLRERLYDIFSDGAVINPRWRGPLFNKARRDSGWRVPNFDREKSLYVLDYQYQLDYADIEPRPLSEVIHDIVRLSRSFTQERKEAILDFIDLTPLALDKYPKETRHFHAILYWPKQHFILKLYNTRIRTTPVATARDNPAFESVNLATGIHHSALWASYLYLQLFTVIYLKKEQSILDLTSFYFTDFVDWAVPKLGINPQNISEFNTAGRARQDVYASILKEIYGTRTVNIFAEYADRMIQSRKQALDREVKDQQRTVEEKLSHYLLASQSLKEKLGQLMLFQHGDPDLKGKMTQLMTIVQSMDPITYINIEGNRMIIEVKAPINYDIAIMEAESAGYQPAKQLLKKIEDNGWQLYFYGRIIFDADVILTRQASAFNIDRTSALNNGLNQNPHLSFFGCTGTFGQEIIKATRAGNFPAMLSLLIQMVGNLNLNDGTVCENFMNKVRDGRYTVLDKDGNTINLSKI